MDLEQLAKRLTWLEDNYRKDTSKINALEDRVIVQEGELAAARQLINEQNAELSRLGTMLVKIDHFEGSLSQYRVEFNRAIEEVQQAVQVRDKEAEEIRRVQIDQITTQVLEIRKGLDPIPEIQQSVKNRMEEEFRLGREIANLEQKLIDFKREEEADSRNVRLLEEGRRQDTKRLTDLQGEVFALRKRVDDHRGRIELAQDGIRKTDNKVVELSSLDTERREMVNTFFEKQALQDVERDRKWKEWNTRFDSIESRAMEFEGHVQTIESARRDLRKLQERIESAIDRAERRINEITEMQRLAEDRFRQEWSTFKADDQKRWTNYSLTQEEQAREISRQQSRLSESITELEDQTQEIEDITRQANDQAEKRIQSLLALVRDWVSDYERVFGQAR